MGGDVDNVRYQRRRPIDYHRESKAGPFPIGLSEVLVIHPGGLGDVCLSESTFLSLKAHFGDHMGAVGNKRALDRFGEYFTRVESIDARAWMPLFSDFPDSRHWKTIVLFGKDRPGSIRHRLRQRAANLIFIDMYPDKESVPVEEYQLRQLPQWGIEPLRKDLPVKTGNRIILYPERPYRKEKWPAEHFVEVNEELKKRGLTTILMRPRNLALPSSDLESPESLDDVAAFFSSGGFFFSNDSGMAHFAAACGLRTLTLFSASDPAVWRPRNGRVLPHAKRPPTVYEAVEFIISATGEA
jgi:ADP-heptose:LPS heptosyltransferase